MKKTLLHIILVLFCASLHANIKVAADSAYAIENYNIAIENYKQLLENGKHADVYYNLGNSYYKMGDIARAILNYERALTLKPWDDDIQHNLELARSKTIDKIVPQSEMFFITWIKNLIASLTMDVWATISIVTFIITLTLLLLYLLSNKLVIRKISFFTSIFTLILCASSIIFSWMQFNRSKNRSEAIVISSAVDVKSTPNLTGTDVFVIHSGTKVEIVDDTMTEWKEVRLQDGKIGWLRTNDIEKI